MVIGALKRLELLRTRSELRENLWAVVHRLQNGLRENGFNIGNTNSCVTPVFVPGNVAEGTNIVIDLRETYSIFCSIVVYPVVPKDVVMLRIIPTAVHTMEDVDYTINCFKEMRGKLDAGKYKSEEIISKVE